ncbi:TetR/AcrR family transcriptional regulator [Erythrobacter crassostreae]|uniref:TetR/AcrR family transcriptional regulator n=1 Tax=Erythrobacter crassostreae TaxID=2828328 RepID=A0A9X1JLP8_9SPHN|nr:TetR/AcrR family transcriptional regulator [Erythrobacter crassostrea]MBV7260395.1 TetR/AcrR family transcriptional regulator [Erythrobacter crassostrea]
MALKSYHHGDLRSAILHEARSVLEAEGESAMTMRLIAERVGVSAMAAYKHFANRDAILQALAIEGFNKLAKVTSRARARHKLMADKQLTAIGVAYIMHGIGHPGVYRVMFGQLSSGIPDPGTRIAADQAYSVLCGCLRDNSDYFGFEASEAEAHAFSAWSMAHGMTSLFVEGHARTRNFTTKAQQRTLATKGAELVTRGLSFRKAGEEAQ